MGETWTGRSGRVYELDASVAKREGLVSTVQAVIAKDNAIGPSIIEDGCRAALKMYRGKSAKELKQFRAEARALVGLSQAMDEPPTPRVLDRVGPDDEPGMVLSWCGTDMEMWWIGQHAAPDALPQLCRALADVAKLADSLRRYQDEHNADAGMAPRINPQSILRDENGKWKFGSLGEGVGAKPHDSLESATLLMASSENFIPPEWLFGARVRHPGAMDTWSIGCCLFTMLRVSALLREGTDLPTAGSSSQHFRSHRMALVTDLFTRKPHLFAGRPLDARQFLYPDQLPDRDKKALRKCFPAGDTDEGAAWDDVASAVQDVLNRALCIDPVNRYLVPMEMAGDLDALAKKVSIALNPRTDTNPDGMSIDVTQVVAGVLPQAGAVVRTAPIHVPSPESGPRPILPELERSTKRHEPTEPVEEASTRVMVPDRMNSQARSNRALVELAGRVTHIEAVLDDISKSLGQEQQSGWAPKVVALLLLAQIGSFAFIGMLWLGGNEHVVVADPEPQQEDGESSRSDVADTPPRVEPQADTNVEGQEGLAADTDIDTDGGEAPVIEEEELVPIVEPIPAPVPAVVVPVVPPPSKKITKTATPKKVEAKPVNAQSELAEEPLATTGTIQITGAEAYLEGPNGRVEPGALLPGSYDLFANVAGGQFRRVRSITIEAGQNLQFHCGMGTCRQVN